MDYRDDVGIPDHAKAATRAAGGLLGLCLRDADAMADASPLLKPGHFRDPDDGAIWGACLGLHSAGKVADAVSVLDEMTRTGRAWPQLAARLAELLDSFGTAAALPQYAAAVRDYALLRDLGQVAARVGSRCNAPDAPAAQILADAERELLALAEAGIGAGPRKLAEVLHDVHERINERTRTAAIGKALTGVSTGLAPLDDRTGGLQPGSLVILAARPSVGKTAVSGSMSIGAARAGHSVLFCSLEQSSEELGERLLSAESGVVLHNLRVGAVNETQANDILDARDRLAPSPLYLDDSPSQGVLHIGSAARRLKRRGQLGLVVVDYLQLIDHEQPRSPLHERIGATSQALKRLARELEVPVLALCQLNREVEGRNDGRPRLSDLRGSGEIEQNADVVVLLHRDRDRLDQLEFIVAKQRNGPVGEFTVRFQRDRMRLECMEQTPYTG